MRTLKSRKKKATKTTKTIKTKPHRTDTNKTKQKPDTVGDARKVNAPDASPDYIINNITANTKAIRNKRFFSQLGHREAGMTKQQMADQDARMRQALMLLTGGCADADLFVQPATGKLKHSAQINAAIQDLTSSYRMQHGRIGAFVKRLLRGVEQLTQRCTAVYHFGVVAVALASIVGTQQMLNKTLKTFTKVFKHKLQQSNLKSALLTLALFAYPTLTQSKHADVFRIVITNATDGITKWRSAQLVNAVFTDGISSDNLASMKKVARELIAIDQAVERLKANGEIPTQRLAQKVEQFRKSNRSVRGVLTLGNWVSNKEQLARLFDYVLKNPTFYTRNTLIREMIGVCGSTHIRGYHFLTSYGDRRGSVKDILAAYLVAYKKGVQSVKQFKEKLLPTVAAKSSIGSAKRRQYFTHIRKSKRTHNSTQKKKNKPAKSTPATIERKINNLLLKHNAVVFSKTYCPHCKRVKEILNTSIQNGQCKVLELDNLKDGKDIQAVLAKMTKQSTVPNVFIRGQHIGGCDAVEARQQKLGYVVDEGE